MKLNVLMTLTALLAGALGLAFVLAPGQVIALYGPTVDAPLKYVGQLLGAALITFAVLAWSARNVSDSPARRAIVLAFFIGDAIGFIVALIGQLGGIVNALGWSTVVIYLLFALGYGYFQFSKHHVSSSRVSKSANTVGRGLIPLVISVRGVVNDRQYRHVGYRQYCR